MLVNNKELPYILCAKLVKLIKVMVFLFDYLIGVSIHLLRVVRLLMVFIPIDYLLKRAKIQEIVELLVVSKLFKVTELCLQVKI
jgi:hypothetical protein